MLSPLPRNRLAGAHHAVSVVMGVGVCRLDGRCGGWMANAEKLLVLQTEELPLFGGQRSITCFFFGLIMNRMRPI